MKKNKRTDSRSSGDALADILLDLINTMANIETRLIKIQATTEKLEGSLNQLVGNNEDLRNTLAKIDEKITEISKIISRIELAMDYLASSRNFQILKESPRRKQI